MAFFVKAVNARILLSRCSACGLSAALLGRKRKYTGFKVSLLNSQKEHEYIWDDLDSGRKYNRCVWGGDMVGWRKG